MSDIEATIPHREQFHHHHGHLQLQNYYFYTSKSKPNYAKKNSFMYFPIKKNIKTKINHLYYFIEKQEMVNVCLFSGIQNRTSFYF